MNVAYKREGGRNYLLISSEEENVDGSGVSEEGAQLEMIRRNKIEGLAPLYVEWEDNRKYYGYDITGFQPVSRLLEFEVLKSEEMRELLSQLAGLLFRMDQYLLDRDKIILNPEYLYASPDRRAYLFFFYPEQGGGYREHIKELAGYLLEKSGDDAVLLRSVWRFYRLCSEKEPEPEALFRCLGEEGDRQAVQKEAIEAEAYSEKNDTEKAEAKGRKNKKENREVKKREDTGDDIGKYKEGNKRKNREKMIKKKAGILEKIKMFFKRWFDSQPYSEEEMWDEQDYAQNVKESAQFVYENPTELLYWDEQSASTPVLYCKEKKEKVPVTKFPFFIGMQNGVDYKPDFGGVSRLHLKLEKKGERYYITDLNSTNGTKLNGENLCPNEERQVVQGDFIWIAGLSYEFLEFDRAEKSW